MESSSILSLFAFAVSSVAATTGGQPRPLGADWSWWNWSVGTLLTWCLDRVISLLQNALRELTEARTQLIENAARGERLRVSRDVHDLVGHSLTAMLLNIRAAKRSMDTDLETAKNALSDAEQVGVTGISDIRSVLLELRGEHDTAGHTVDEYSSLPDGELVLALLQTQNSIEISTVGDIEFKRLNPDVDTVQGALVDKRCK